MYSTREVYVAGLFHWTLHSTDRTDILPYVRTIYIDTAGKSGSEQAAGVECGFPDGPVVYLNGGASTWARNSRHAT